MIEEFLHYELSRSSKHQPKKLDLHLYESKRVVIDSSGILRRMIGGIYLWGSAFYDNYLPQNIDITLKWYIDKEKHINYIRSLMTFKKNVNYKETRNNYFIHHLLVQFKEKMILHKTEQYYNYVSSDEFKKNKVMNNIHIHKAALPKHDCENIAIDVKIPISKT